MKKNENKNVEIFKPENLSLDGKKAEQTYSFALKISPCNPDALFNLGLLKLLNQSIPSNDTLNKRLAPGQNHSSEVSGLNLLKKAATYGHLQAQ